MTVFARTPDPVMTAPTVTVPVTADTVKVVPEIEPVQEKLVVDDVRTGDKEVLYPDGVAPVMVIEEPTEIVVGGYK
jgi:hypothetical protein